MATPSPPQFGSQGHCELRKDIASLRHGNGHCGALLSLAWAPNSCVQRACPQLVHSLCAGAAWLTYMVGLSEQDDRLVGARLCIDRPVVLPNGRGAGGGKARAAREAGPGDASRCEGKAGCVVPHTSLASHALALSRARRRRAVAG